MSISNLEEEIRLIEKKREALLSLLNSSKISQNTFDLFDKNISHLVSTIISLRESLEEEKTFWTTNKPEETKVLELILLDLKVCHLLGDLGSNEWDQKSEIIGLGLDSLKGYGNPVTELACTQAPPTQSSKLHDKDNLAKGLLEAGSENLGRAFPTRSLEKDSEHKKKRIPRKKHFEIKNKKKISQEIATPNSGTMSQIHCMNPWKPSCERTDVELTIYYQGQATPICRGCWEEISKKDIEWSGP